jgi:hypothetical protein
MTGRAVLVTGFPALRARHVLFALSQAEPDKQVFALVHPERRDEAREALAQPELSRAKVELIEGDRELPRVAAGRFDPETGGAQITSTHEDEALEAHERDLLRELVHGGITRCEHRSRDMSECQRSMEASVAGAPSR